jgi:hypothetical protein
MSMIPIWAVLRASRQRFFDGHRRAACELVFGCELINLILFSQPLDKLQELSCKQGLFRPRAIPQRLEVANLLGGDLAREALRQSLRRLHLSGEVVVFALDGVLNRFGLVGAEDAPFALLQHRDQCVEAWPQPLDLAWLESNRPRQLLFGELPRRAEHQHVFERPGNHVRRRLGWRGKVLRVVRLVGMDDAAETIAE